MVKVQTQMEKFATDNLPAYASILSENAKKTAEMMMTAVGLAAEGIGAAMDRLGKLKDAVTEPSTKDKLAGAGVGMVAGAATGALVGSVIPVVGTAVGAAVGGLLGGAAGWFAAGAKKGGSEAQADLSDTAIPQAAGGIVAARKGGTLIQIAEAGLNEANVPLPDGRRIPVDMPMGQLSSSISEIVTKFSSDQVSMQKNTSDRLEETLKLLTEKFDSLHETMGKQNDTGGVMSDVANHLKEMKETAMKQLDIHGTMASLLGENKDISNSILNNSY
jgi:hypothetical protein